MNPTFTPAPVTSAHADIQAIIARPPARLTRWGTTILLLIVGGLLTSTVFIRYAERISVPLWLAAAEPPVPVPLAPAMRVGQLCVQPHELVAPGQLLGYATDGPSVSQLLSLARALGDAAGTALPAYHELGALQADYERLACHTSRAEDAARRAALRQRAQQWLAAHALHAPAAGRVSYCLWAGVGTSRYLGLVSAPLYIVPVVPPGTEVGRLLITQRQLRYLKERQQVQVSFEAYPAGEYGTVSGQIAGIADLPEKDGSYQALVVFPHGLRTTTNQYLTYRAGMHATAEIVVARRPLIQQLFPLLTGAS